MPKSKKTTASAAQLLGTTVKDNSPRSTNLCTVCHKEIPKARLEALQTLNIPITQWAHVNCSQVTKVKGLYLGEVGTSHLQICNKVYNDSVRSVFRSAEVKDDDDDGDVEIQ